MLPMTGVELARKVHEAYPHIKILALSMSGEVEMVNQMIKDESVQGYVLKNIGRRELVTALEWIANGGTYYSDEVLETLAKDTDRKKIIETVHLTDREVEIIKLIEIERNNKQIADQLCISERTVETHRKNIFRKTKTTSLIGLIKYAYEYKII
jgi:DNA-binding NarL/FixJ family response regulator